MNTLTILVILLCVYALAYRYYSAFLAAKVMVLQDTRITPAHLYQDGQNYSPMRNSPPRSSRRPPGCS